MDYVCQCATCGALWGWISSEMPRKDQAKFAADVVRDERMKLGTMTTEDARKHQWHCGCHTAKPEHAPQVELSL